MADKKNSSRATKAVSDAKKSTVKNQTSGKTAAQKAASGSTKKPANKKQPPVVKTEYDRPRMPSNVLTAIISLILFVLFLFACFLVEPEAAFWAAVFPEV